MDRKDYRYMVKMDSDGKCFQMGYSVFKYIYIGKFMKYSIFFKKFIGLGEKREDINSHKIQF